MSRFSQFIIGGIEVGAGFALALTGVGAALAPYLVTMGYGSLISGLGTLLSKGPVRGLATTERNPVGPWKVIYGRAAVGGTVVYMNMWGDSDKMLDLVIVLAAHSCEGVDVLLFDQQRVQIDTNAAPAGVKAGSGTSFTPVQQKVNIAEIKRVSGVVTVTLPANIPYLLEGDRIQIAEDGPGTLAANALVGTVQVAEILSQVAGSPGSITFTYLSGGANCDITGHGHVHTLWADYGRKVYFEWLDGTQALGQTFKGMAGTPYDGDKSNVVNPDHQGGLGGGSSDVPNPWTGNCSLQGKTAVFLRLHYNDQYFKGGLPQISFLVRGKNDILDPRTSPATHGYSENAALCIADFLANQAWGFKAAYATEIPYPALIAAANTCDEPVPLAISSGSPPVTEPAYACNGQFDLTMKRGEILQNLLTSCAGRVTYLGGQHTIWPAAWRGISFAIGSNPGGGVTALGSFDSLNAGPIKWRPTVSIRDLYNGVKGTYISKANRFKATDFPPYAQDALHGYSGPSLYGGDANLAADGGDRRWLDIQLPFTISAAAAQRIAKIELLRRRKFGTGTFVLNMRAYPIVPMDLIELTNGYLSFSGKQLEVLEARLRLEKGGSGQGPALLYDIDVQETDASVYDWQTSEELSPQGYQHPAIPGIGSFEFFATELTPGFSVPFPWSPAYAKPFVGDALYPGPVTGSPPVNEGLGTFGMKARYGLDAQGNATANLEIKGAPAANELSRIPPAEITAVAGTGGHLPAGKYVLACSATDAATGADARLGVPQVVMVGANGKITIAVTWPPGSNGGEIYAGLLNENLPNGMKPGAAGYWFQKTLLSTDMGCVITELDRGNEGAPDPANDHLAVVWTKVVHGGVWAQQIQAVRPNEIDVFGLAMTADLWAGRVLTLLGKLDSTQEMPVLNMAVQHSSASSSPGGIYTLTIGPNTNGDTLPDLTTLLVEGDLVLMRFHATFSAQGFTDALIANPYYPGGDTAIEAGHVAVVLTGPDAGDMQTIESIGLDGFGNPTVILLAAPWKVQPNDGDIVIVVEAGWSPEAPGIPLPVSSRAQLDGTVAASPLITNLAGQTWLFLVRTETANGISGDDAFAPMREMYFFGSQGTRTVATTQTMLPTDQKIDFDASGGPIVFTLLPGVQIPNQQIWVQKIDASANEVTILPDPGSPNDLFNNGENMLILANQGDGFLLKVSGG